MPLEVEIPRLDTRTFDNLLSEARLRIPRYTPEWTDFNESDPGITLVQLFAWLSEMLLVQFNQIPERHYLKFLQLLNLELRPAQAALAHLTFTAQANATSVDSVRLRTPIQAQPPEGGEPLVFETEEGLDLIRLPLSDVQVLDGAEFADRTTANQPSGIGFRPLGWIPQVGNALYLGFAPPQQPLQGRIFPQQLRFRVFLPSAAQAGQPQSCNEARQPPAPPVTLAWEYKRTATTRRWERLNVYRDESVAFTREGYLLLEGPAEIAATQEGKQQQPRYWLRCRLIEGSYVNGHYPEIDFIRPNVTSARHLATVREEVVGISDGHPGVTFRLARTPVLFDSLTLEIQQSAESPREPWKWVEDLLASKPDEPHYTLNHNTGEIRFGDGRRGRIPPAGAEIIAREYRYGGGTAGNVGPGLINAPLINLTGVATVSNERRAEGGQDEQAIRDLKEKAPAMLRSGNRTVTAEDFAALAAQAGGVRRATAIPLAHPDHRDVEVPGAVTVVIVPDTADSPPRPSPDLIRQVCSYLDGFRLITTEVFVKGPEYQAVKVEVTVAAQPYAAFDAVSRDIEKALKAYLDPSTKEFGQDFYPTGFYDVILDVANIMAVQSLRVFVNGRLHEPLNQRVVLRPDELLFGTDHAITVVPWTEG